MARPGITQEQVFEAATALQDEGTVPTVQSVRERIGSGSYTTITPMLNAWRDEHAKSAPAHVPDIPETVRGLLGRFGRQPALPRKPIWTQSARRLKQCAGRWSGSRPTWFRRSRG